MKNPCIICLIPFVVNGGDVATCGRGASRCGANVLRSIRHLRSKSKELKNYSDATSSRVAASQYSMHSSFPVPTGENYVTRHFFGDKTLNKVAGIRAAVHEGRYDARSAVRQAGAQ